MGLGGYATGDTLISIERVIGTGAADILIGAGADEAVDVARAAVASGMLYWFGTDRTPARAARTRAAAQRALQLAPDSAEAHIALGETDDWAHSGEYGHVLDSFHYNDQQFKELWDYLQSSPKYKGKTSIIITVDHGRGNTIKDWTDHGEKVPEAQNIWMAFISPDVQLRGEWKSAETIYQNQVAATLCRWLNIDYSENNPQAGKPVARLFSK